MEELLDEIRKIAYYLKITGFESALLINFGSYKFEVRTVVPRFASCAAGPQTQDSFYTSTFLHG